jgi:hypothetical protein
MSGGVALLSSCSNDKIDEPTTEPAAVDDDDDLVYITIMTDDAASRAVYEETEITGTSAESYINPETIHLYPYNATGRAYPSWCCNYIENRDKPGDRPELTATAVKAAGGYRIYLDRKELQECCPSDKSSNYPNMVIVAIANWGVTLDKASDDYKNDVMQMVALKKTEFMYNTESTDNTFNFKSDYVPSEDQPMPMYGMVVATNSNINNTSVKNLGTIYMYRAFAKLIVKCPKTVMTKFGFDEDNVTLKYCYSAGTCGPANLVLKSDHVVTTATPTGVYNNLSSSNIFIPGEIPADKFKNSTASDLATTPDLIENLKFNRIKTDDPDYDWYQLYIPEFRTQSATITLGNNGTYDATGKDNWIEFVTANMSQKYGLDFKDEKNNGLDIVRNHIYLFEVDGTLRSSFKFNYVVTDWDYQASGDITFD